jgi:PAS domain S-box-containing protein
VLIIDDNVELVGSLHAVLMSAELSDGRAASNTIEVVTASRGDEGLAEARARGFDVAIVDVKLPDTSGVLLIPKLRAACPFGEIVLMTGFATMDAAIGALRSGAYAFVPKSFRPEELISTVEQAVSKVRLAREREELERRYRALAELTDVLVVGLDAEGRVALFNRKAASYAGVEAGEAVGLPFIASSIPDGDAERMREAVAHARSGRTQEVETGFDPVSPGRGPGQVSSSALREAPARRRVRWHLSMARGSSEETSLVYGIGIDVTERRALEKRAADAEALSAMGTLALNLAHEIRNPLNAAILQLHLLGRQVDKLPVDESARGALRHKAQIVGDEIGRLSRMLTEFLELARPRGAVREAVQFSKLVDDVLALEQEPLVEAGVVVERDLATDCALVGDPEKLKQVVINLVMNAIDAMKEGGGRLGVRTSTEGDTVRLAVQDSGGGIERALLPQVFDPFFTTKAGGTGLGLSIVRKIIDLHGGEIRIESERGKGTEVTVVLPRG